MRLINKILATFFLLFFANVFSQESWTLTHCVLLGEQNSNEIIIAGLNKAVSQADTQSLSSYFLPGVTANIGQNYNFGSTIDPSTNSRVGSNIGSTNFNMDVNLTLLDWSFFAEHKRKSLSIDYASLSELELKYNYKLRILELFFQILELQELVGIQQIQLDNSLQNYQRVTKEVEAGAKPQSDFYDIEFVFSSERISQNQTQNELFNRKLALLQLLNVKQVNPDQFVLQYQDEIFEISRNYEFNPFVEKSEIAQEIVLQEKRIIKSNLLPRIMANYQFGSFYSKVLNGDLGKESPTFSKQFADNKSHFVGIGLSIPIFQKGNIKRMLRKKKVEIELTNKQSQQIKLEYEQEKLRLETQIEQLKILESQLSQNILLAQKSFSTTQIKYENGAADIYSFNGAKNQLLNSQFARVKNKIFIVLLYKKLELLNSSKLS
ncbi:TolC family protein [Myroides sp. LJL119]